MRKGKIKLCRGKCVKCGNIYEFIRKQARLKKKEHIKHIYCIICKYATEHKEIVE